MEVMTVQNKCKTVSQNPRRRQRDIKSAAPQRAGYLPLAAYAALLLWLWTFPLTVSADGGTADACVWVNGETGYQVVIEDDADLLSEQEETQLAAEMQQITSYGHVAFKSVSRNDYQTSAYARQYYHEHFSSNSGTLFLIDMDNREIYIFSNGAIYKTVTDAYADTITDNVYRYASDSNYYLCASNAFSQIHSLLAGRRIAQPMKYISNALLALILAAFINYFAVRLTSRSAKPGTQEILSAASTKFSFTNPRKTLDHQTKVYRPASSDSGGSGHSGGGGGHSGGGGGHSSGGGGGHSSGGGGGQRF